MLLGGLRPAAPWAEATDPAHCRSAVSLRPAVLVRGGDLPEPPVRHSPLGVLLAALHPPIAGAADAARGPEPPQLAVLARTDRPPAPRWSALLAAWRLRPTSPC